MSKYYVGAYVIVPEKPFTSMDKAVDYIQARHPELSRETIEERIDPKIKLDGTDKSDNTTEKSEGSKSESSEINSGGAKGAKPSSNKPG
ncbi:hypothetical protein [Chryseobacterium sp. JK1]|uniref:hypothetical protein n=1 Tax=Chryseobacterium sp. JK1 TaxID=874294 RepID=UPI003D690E64